MFKSVKVYGVTLQNYCGYTQNTFDFSDATGQGVKPFTTFFGPNGIGKSSKKTTYVISDGKMVQIGSLFDQNKLPEEEGWVPLEKPIWLGINGDVGKCTRLYFSGLKKYLEVKTSCGYMLAGSKDRHLVLSPDSGLVGFKRFIDMKPGDKVAISRKSPFVKQGVITDDEAMLLGYLVSEGACAQEYGVQFTNTDKDVLSHYDKLHTSVIGFTPTTSVTRTCVRKNTLQMYRSKLDAVGLTRVLSGEKTVPSTVMAGTRSCVAAFLRTYFEGDGGIESSIQAVTCASKSYRLLHEVHLLLLRLGIISSLKIKNIDKLSYVDKPYTSWRITIQGDDVLKFAREIGFVSSRKKEELDDLLLEMSAMQRNPNKDVIPAELFRPMAIAIRKFREDAGITFTRKEYKTSSNGLHCLQPNYLDLVKSGISKDKIETCVEMINSKVRAMNVEAGGIAVAEEIDLNQMTDGFWDENYFFDAVETITEGEDELFDLEVEGEHRYWTNGFISHNSTCLHAIRLAANPNAFKNRERDSDMMLRKSIHDEEYLPSVDNVQVDKVKNEMLITVDFLVDTGVKTELRTVQIDNHGLLRNDLGYDHTPLNGFCYFADADNPMNTARFLLAFEQAEKFVAFSESVYGYRCELGLPINQGGIKGYTDFLIKKGNVKVHFKSMSAGEKKIATLISDLCQPINTSTRDIILIDNVEMHVYFKRHTKMIDKLREIFADKQIISTTHSSIVVKHVEPECHFDLEVYRPEYKLFEDNIKVSNVVLAQPIVQDWGFAKPGSKPTVVGQVKVPAVAPVAGVEMKTTRVVIRRPGQVAEVQE